MLRPFRPEDYLGTVSWASSASAQSLPERLICAGLSSLGALGERYPLNRKLGVRGFNRKEIKELKEGGFFLKQEIAEGTQ